MNRPKILVIDDEAGPREALRMILKTKYDVYLAERPIKGLALVEEHRPDLVFVDIRMPQMEGTEVLRRIKELDAETEVAIITAYAAIDSAQEAVRYGAIDYLTKPFGVHEVLRVVERALARRTERREKRLLIQQLQQATQNLSEQLRNLRAPSGGGDRAAIFEGLASAHNSIETQLEDMSRLSAIGEIAAEVAHDVDNFLSAILLRIEMLLMNLRHAPTVGVSDVEGALQDIVQATQDSAHAIARISLVSTDPYQTNEAVQINEVLQDAWNLSEGQAPADSKASVDWQLEDLPEFIGNTPALRTAFTNVLINARQAISGEGQVCMRTRADEEYIEIVISDTGEGITPEILHRITEPFFTTKGPSGSGLGLSIVRKVVTRHSGSLDFQSTPGEGTTVTIRLPRLKTPDTLVAPPNMVPQVLVVEDDEEILALIQDLLAASGLEVHATDNGRSALVQFERYLEHYQRTPPVVITDLRIPHLLGTELAQRIKELAPETRVVLVSGYLDEIAELSNCSYLDAVLTKPFNLSDLLEEVMAAPALSASASTASSA